MIDPLDPPKPKSGETHVEYAVRMATGVALMTIMIVAVLCSFSMFASCNVKSACLDKQDGKERSARECSDMTVMKGWP